MVKRIMYQNAIYICISWYSKIEKIQKMLMSAEIKGCVKRFIFIFGSNLVNV